MKRLIVIGLLTLGSVSHAVAEKIGEVSTVYRAFSANDKITVEVFDDPDIVGVSCYLSRAKTGGVTGFVGLAEDGSDASLECSKITDHIKIPDDVAKGNTDGESVFKKSTSILFKTIQVVRFYDPKRKVLVYLTYSDKLIEGSPQNSISVVPVI